MSEFEPELREITTKCDECDHIEEFASDNLKVKVDDDWEQTCTQYPECDSEHATIIKIITG